LEAITGDGLTVKLPSAEEFTIDAKATNDLSAIGPVDLVLFCVKTYYTDVAAEQVRPMVGPETISLRLKTGWIMGRGSRSFPALGILFPA